MAVDVEPTAASPDLVQEGGNGGGPGRPAARRRWSPRAIVVALAVVAALGAVLVFTGGPENPQPATDDPPENAAPSLSGELNDGYVVFTDPETGISLQYPENWIPLRRPQGSQRLVVGPGDKSSLSVRVETIDGVVDTPEELAQIQAVTDRIAGGPEIQVVQREAVELNGMVGISYLGRFTDEASGTKVVNAHYFLFKGNTMHILLFQVAPEEDFEALAPELDKILASFQGVPTEEAPAEPAE